MAAEANAPGSGGNGAVADRIAKLNRMMDEVQAANARAKTVGRVMTVLVVVAAFAGVYMLLKPFATAYQDPKPYKDAFSEEFKSTILPKLTAEMNSNGKRIATEVKDQVVKKIEARQDELFGSVDRELKTFVANLQAHGTKEFETRQAEIRAHIEKTLVADVPELKDPAKVDTIMVNASAAMDASVQRLMEKHFAEHMHHMLSIERRINQFPVPDEYAKMTNEQLSEAMVNQVGVYATMMLRGSLTPNTKAVLQAVAEPTPAPANP